MKRVLRTIRDHALIAPGDRVAVGLSGGADSVALLLVLRDLEAAGDLGGALAGVIHVNHGLRGDEAARDERFCRALAARVGLPIEIGVLDVAAAARASRRSIETTARQLRYAFFTEAAARLGATRVATGHTLDDQAETVLLRLLRGAGSRGLSGIRIRRGPFIRPLLECSRRAVRVELAARNEPFCEDSSNLDPRMARNRVRHELLPVIERLAPGGIAALARVASLAAADERYLQRAAIKAAASIVLFTGGGVQVNGEALSTLPLALARRVVRGALDQVAPGGDCSALHLNAVLALASAAGPGGHLDLPGVSVERRGPQVHMNTRTGRSGRPVERVEFDIPLPVPGRAEVAVAGLIVTAQTGTADIPDRGLLVPDEAVVQASAVALPLSVRNRRPGDRLRPLGAPGHRKLQDLLVDRKVPREARDRVPLVVDAAGRIVWVAGYVIADDCRVTAPARGVVVLKVHREGLLT